VSVRFAGILLATMIVGCQIVQVETPDPAAIPSGSLLPQGADPSGPLVEVGSGVTSGIGWRFVVYPSEDGWCTQLETGTATRTGCGDLAPEEGRAFGSVGHDGPMVEGVVTEETATVWVIADGGGRLPATLMPLEEAGLEGQAFVGILPSDEVVTHLQAVKFNGDVLETFELP
jgi:hypothetical protein